VQDLDKERLRMREVEGSNVLVGEGCEVCFEEERREIVVEVRCCVHGVEGLSRDDKTRW
jgi:hypothetical protein